MCWGPLGGLPPAVPRYPVPQVPPKQEQSKEETGQSWSKEETGQSWGEGQEGWLLGSDPRADPGPGSTLTWTNKTGPASACDEMREDTVPLWVRGRVSGLHAPSVPRLGGSPGRGRCHVGHGSSSKVAPHQSQNKGQTLLRAKAGEQKAHTRGKGWEVRWEGQWEKHCH